MSAVVSVLYKDNSTFPVSFSAQQLLPALLHSLWRKHLGICTNVRDKPTRLLTLPWSRGTLHWDHVVASAHQAYTSLVANEEQICEKTVPIQLHLQKTVGFIHLYTPENQQWQAGKFQEFESMYLDYFPN